MNYKADLLHILLMIMIVILIMTMIIMNYIES
jgi:hypothetical protein